MNPSNVYDMEDIFEPDMDKLKGKTTSQNQIMWRNHPV